MNRKVPLAILCCFLITFILQGTLKLCGVFVFEKALDWDIFRIIDSSQVLTIIFYSIINLIAVFCFSFTFTSNPYSKKWWHYVIMVGVTVPITALRCKVQMNIPLGTLFDIINYIILPIAINLSTSKEYRVYSKSKLTNCVTISSLQILLYITYLGLNYWSGLLNEVSSAFQHILYASSNFLIILEVYIGTALLMLTMNMIISEIKKGGADMFIPMNVASDEAKEKELQEHKEKLENKKKK